MVCLPFSSPLPSKSITPTRVTKTHWVKGEKYIVCVHACMPASTQSLSSWELSRIQRPVHSTVWTEPLGEEEALELQGLWWKSQGKWFKSSSTANPPIHTHTHTISPLRTPLAVFFSTVTSALKAIKCNMKASYDYNLLSLWSPFSLPWGVFSKCSVLNRSIYLVNLCLNVCLPLRH